MLILSIQDKDLLTKLPPQMRGHFIEYSFHTSLLCIQCCVKATNTSVNCVDKYSIQCIAYFDLHIDSVDKQDTMIPYSIYSSIALIFCINCLDMPFNVHLNCNVDSNTKTSNYMKIRFKALIYFELQETSK